jgi:hypothetical protein
MQLKSRSLTYGQFPQVRFSNGRRFLWNPVVKELFKPRPEERVRLQVIEFLHRRAGISISRMSSEKGIRLSYESAGRTDLIVYDKSLKPHLLVECKAPDVKLNERAAIQISKYNRSLKAEILLLTNGIQDILFRDEQGFVHVSVSSLIVQNEEPERDKAYWYQRGFVSESADESLLHFVRSVYDVNEEIKYLEIPAFKNHPDLSHYYRLISNENLKGWAIGVLTDQNERTWVSGIYFEKGTPQTIVSVDINSGITYYTLLKKPDNPKCIEVSDSEIRKNILDANPAQLTIWFEKLINRI